MNMLGGKFGLNIIRVDASKRFLDLLAGVEDPEKNVNTLVMNLLVYLMMRQANLKVLTS